MIIPINQTRNDVEETVGTANVTVLDGEYVVEFYLRSSFVLDNKVKSELEKELIKLAQKKFDGFSLG